MRGNADAVAGLAHAPFEHARNTELAPDRADILPGALVLEGRRAGGDAQVGDSREGTDELLGDALAEVLLVAIGAHVDEREHRHGGRRARGRADALQALQLVAQIEGRLDSPARVLLQASFDQPPELARHLQIALGEGLRRVTQDRRDHLGLTVAAKWPYSRRHLVEDDPQTENVRQLVNRLRLSLLR